MSSLFKHFQTSEKLMTQGAPVRFPKNDDGTTPVFYVARSHTANQLYAKAVNKHYDADFRERLDSNKADDSETKERVILVFVDGNLIGWENVQNEKGENVSFNRENAIALFNELPELFEGLNLFSKNLSNYLKSKEESDVKN